jgi:hypothetical protein
VLASLALLAGWSDELSCKAESRAWQESLSKKACVHGLLQDEALHIMNSDQLFLPAWNCHDRV